MKIVNTSKQYRIYGDDLKVYDRLPAGVFIVRFSQMQGFYLEKYSGIEVNESKIYGIHIAKINKVMKSFKQFTRNLGIILSGKKGIGKSLFARILCRSAVEDGYPVIVVDQFIPGIHSFIEDIEQEAVVLFDEFDKTFSSANNNGYENNNQSPQVSLLSLLDGVSTGKKLYIITCNEFHSLNEYLINRPGRFHYHFRFDYPKPDEIKTYLQDKISEKYWDEIPKVILFSSKVKLNYDCLRAIAYEIENGEKFEEAIDDLNILNLGDQAYDITLHFKDGSVAQQSSGLDMFSNVLERVWMCTNEGMGLNVSFIPTKAKYNAIKRCSTVDGEGLKLDFNYDENDEIQQKIVDNLLPDHLTIIQREMDSYRYAV